jgi:protein-disulfide isomerase
LIQSIKNFLTHRLLTRYGWFYLALIVTALVSFWAGHRYAQMNQSTTQSLATLLDTNIPEWIKSVEQNPKKKSLGDPDAPVKIIEYMDIECPYCRHYSAKVFPQLVNNYVKSGKVYYVVKHFPLSQRVHPHAFLGAMASECAANQGKFWEFKTLAMENRRYQSKSTFLAIANIVNVPDQEKFSKCLNNQLEAETVKKEARQGQQKGVTGTPTVFIGDEKISGFRPYSEYKSAIQSELDASESSS